MEKEEALKMVMLLHVEYLRLKGIRESPFFEESADNIWTVRFPGK
ncbi:hypothetical protein NSQ91_14305 [Paenibacillus sp. FSL R7-0048]